MIKVKDLKTLMKLKTNNKEGELALVEETRTLYKWDGTNWNIHKDPKGINVSLFELNQSAMTALPPLPAEEIENAKNAIHDFVHGSKQVWFMLLSNEKRYYTVFNTKSGNKELPKIEDEVIECLEGQGQIKAFENLGDSIELWVTTEEQSYVYYLFGYNRGVILCQ